MRYGIAVASVVGALEQLLQAGTPGHVRRRVSSRRLILSRRRRSLSSDLAPAGGERGDHEGEDDVEQDADAQLCGSEFVEGGDGVGDAGENEDCASDAVRADHPLTVLGDVAISGGDKGSEREGDP
jgi:hypothetical protein